MNKLFFVFASIGALGCGGKGDDTSSTTETGQTVTTEVDDTSSITTGDGQTEIFVCTDQQAALDAVVQQKTLVMSSAKK